MDFPPRTLPSLAPAETQPWALAMPTGYNYPPALQAHEPSDVGWSSAFTQQTHLLRGPAAHSTSDIQNPFSLSVVHPGHTQHHLSNDHSEPAIATAAFATPASPMGPPASPAQPRKRKAPTLRAKDWEPYKERVLDLHTTQGLPLWKVKQIIETEYGFQAEERQYRLRITQWGKDKKVKPHEMAAIVRKHQKRRLTEPDKRELVFDVRGTQVELPKIERWMKRHKVADSFLYSPSPAASTPSAVGCHTISERGSPTMMFAQSPAATILSPGDAHVAAQISQMPSPALSSVSSIVHLQNSVFTGQSPALTPRSLVLPEDGRDVNIPLRYRGDKEERLRDEILRMEMSSESTFQERSSVLCDLGFVLIDQGRFRAAENVARRLVEGHKSQGGDDDNDEELLRALSLLGQVLNGQGLYGEAERLHRRALRVRQKVLGEEHPKTLISMGNLAFTYWKQGRWKEAEELEVQVMEKTVKILGEEHRDTLISISNLAATYWKQGRWKEAEELEVQVMEKRVKILGEEHSDTLKSKSNLGATYWGQGRWKEAQALEVHVMEKRLRVLGKEHPDTLVSMERLAMIIQDQDRNDEAISLMEKCYQLRRRILGDQHPDTKSSLSALQRWQAESSETAF